MIIPVAATGAAFLMIHRRVLEAFLERGFSEAFPFFQESELSGTACRRRHHLLSAREPSDSRCMSTPACTSATKVDGHPHRRMFQQQRAAAHAT